MFGLARDALLDNPPVSVYHMEVRAHRRMPPLTVRLLIDESVDLPPIERLALHGSVIVGDVNPTHVPRRSVRRAYIQQLTTGSAPVHTKDHESVSADEAQVHLLFATHDSDLRGLGARFQTLVKVQ